MKWSWQGVAAFTLAAGLAAALVILSIGEFFHDGHLTETEATTIATVLGAMVGAIATYLGTKEDRGSP